VIPPAEDAAVADVVQMIHDAYVDKYKVGAHAYRMAHAKAHGCLNAVFEVSASVPEDLRNGVFVEPGKSYDAWIRFSNGAPEIEGDRAPASRGFALKILGVPGTKLLDEEPGSQDFLMHNFPSFLAKDAEAVIKFFRSQIDQRATPGQRAQEFWRSIKRPDENMVRELERTLQIPANRASSLLTQQFWSGLPSSNNGVPVKFTAVPCAGNQVSWNPIEGASPDFLRKRLKRRLAQGDACFEFKVQRFVSDETTPVEDGTAIWPETAAQGGSPYVQVATIRIPKQNFDTPERDAFCENLSFTPWHSLPEHRPLGGLNRLRRAVYLESSRYRHQWNGTSSPVR
jgi:catalase